MPSPGAQMMGAVLGFVGWLGTIIGCGLPMWRVTAFIDTNILTAIETWEGLWMNCVVQSTGQRQCKVYGSMLALPQHLQVARAMVVISVIVGAFGVLVAVIGGKCTKCLEDNDTKAKVSVVSGVTFMTSALLIIIPVSWSAHSVIRDFYDPLVLSSLKRELGASLFIGWGSGGLLLLGGSLLCIRCPPNHDRPYMSSRFASSNMNYV